MCVCFDLNSVICVFGLDADVMFRAVSLPVCDTMSKEKVHINIVVIN